METVKLQTESFLFQNADEEFRAIPFYELSIEECIIYEKAQPKYLLDFNRRDKPLIQDIKAKLYLGEELEDAIWKLGRFLGKDWTTKHNIEGDEIPNSQKTEVVELLLLDDLSELYIDLTFVATDKVDFSVLLNEEKLFDTYLSTDLGLESASIDTYDNLVKLLSFIFKKNLKPKKLTESNGKELYDLTEYQHDYITVSELDQKYQDYILISGRENNMDEYGNLIGIIGYIKQNVDKRHLLLIAERRKHCA